MKIRFYRYLFQNMKELTPTEKVVYSYVLSHSIALEPMFYDDERHICKQYIVEFLEEKIAIGARSRVKRYKLSQSKIAKDLGMSRNTVKAVMDSLYEKYTVTDSTIDCPIELINTGYVECDTDLSGKQLVLYLYLKDRSQPNHGIITSWAKTFYQVLGESLQVSEKGIYDLLAALEGKQLIEYLGGSKRKIK